MSAAPVAIWALATACLAPPSDSAPASAIDTHYRLMRRAGSHRPAVATRAYRGILARSLLSDCELVPSDSVAFDYRVRTCGATNAVIAGAARLMLEVSARPQFLRPVRMKDRLRWLDLLDRDSCALH